MTHEEKKTAKIVEELTMFFFALEASYIDARIEREEDRAVIRVEADFNPAYADKLSHLDPYLNGKKTTAWAISIGNWQAAAIPAKPASFC